MNDDRFTADCPTRTVLDSIGGRWPALVMMALASRPRRFAELSRQIEGISQKMLTQTLKSLERDGFITRSVVCARPIHVDYALTPLGMALLPVLQALRAWSEANIAGISDARAAYDGT